MDFDVSEGERVQRQRQNDGGHSGKRCVPQDSVEKVQGQADLQWSRPERVEEAHKVHEPLRVH